IEMSGHELEASLSDPQEISSAHKCDPCSLVFRSAKDFRDHKRGRHPSKVRIRILDENGDIVQRDLKPVNGQFVCPVCDQGEIRTRSGILYHTNKHLSEVQNPRASKHECFICAGKFPTARDLDRHFDENHPDIHEVSEDPHEDDVARAKIWNQAKIELDASTTSPLLSNYILETLSPYSAHHKGGQTSLGLHTQVGAKREASDPIIGWEPIKRPKIRVHEGLEDLRTTLASHRFGKLIELDSYSLLESSFFVQDYKQFKNDIARNLAGALIHTGSQAILFLNVEIYGRTSDEDPHSFNLARPTFDVKIVTTVEHDSCRKLIIGTLFWSALVTSSIELTSGTISVGAHNKSAEISPRSAIWGREDWELNPLAERQLRSKFYRKETFVQGASTFFQFSYWNCVPTTVFSLNHHFSSKSSMSGIRASALLFHQIMSSKSRNIKKKSLITILENDKISDAPKTQQIVADLLRLIPLNQKKLKLIDNWEASNLLRQLASTLCGAITTKTRYLCCTKHSSRSR
ncbi:hypothetical protein BGX27_002657, partial [Mortierella sp. AM989]